MQPCLLTREKYTFHWENKASPPSLLHSLWHSNSSGLALLTLRGGVTKKRGKNCINPLFWHQLWNYVWEKCQCVRSSIAYGPTVSMLVRVTHPEPGSWHQSCVCAPSQPPLCPTVHHILSPSPQFKLSCGLEINTWSWSWTQNAVPISLTLAHFLQTPRGPCDGDKPVLFLAVNVKMDCPGF